MRGVLAALVVVATLCLPVVPAAAAPPEGACRGDPESARDVVTQLPWAQQLLDLDRTWPHSTGAGVTVAVVDSGVDADHPQLRGKVLPGADFFLVGDLPGNFDCVSHGTAVASIIAASAQQGVGFRGVAPDARILPVRITDRELNDTGNATPINPGIVADGIRYAADSGASVINLSLSGYGDFPAIRDAVAYARSKDALLVAAVGNRDDQGAVPSFPASYDGVLGVGSVDIDGLRAQGSQVGPYVDLVAPGQDVLAASRVAGHHYWAGTSFAAPFVSGIAALVRAAYPRLSAPEVAARLIATADPAPGGRNSLEYGAGLVDPYRAVTERLTDREPLAEPGVSPKPPDTSALRESAWWADMGAGAKIGAGMVVVAIVGAAILAVALPRARRRRWAAARRPALPDTPGRVETPDQVFLFPTGGRTP
ncbi:type VII secretion-associated serine protease mycosin [Actinophytocola oryzae]|uniref:Type VII secretion-associated serine protease mycosin n=1 Tax=Actinophytocola oryzae TaxID=502181 RepID=A0A4R7UUF0_9PSEU|nr:type VII secretion-associated serine protease mycosin [Actinophytocola oryzae]TDV40070.1 type VII secretion-associated serine protease mycosin [Actinophytocola oryzae]